MSTKALLFLATIFVSTSFAAEPAMTINERELRLNDCGLNLWGGTYHAQKGQNNLNPGLGLKCYLSHSGLYVDVNYIHRNSQSKRGQDRPTSAMGIGYDHLLGEVWDREVLVGVGIEKVRQKTLKGKTLKGLVPVLDLTIREEKLDYNVAFPAVLPYLLGKKVKDPFAEIWFFVRWRFH
jgi:hypothetical protein